MKSEEMKILLEIKQILATLAGTSHLPKEMQFSASSLDKVAKEYKKILKEENQWVRAFDIGKYVKNADNPGAAFFIKNEFQFKNYYQKAASFYYYKKDLINLNKELIARNINLDRYMKLKEDKERIEKATSKYLLRKQKKIETGKYKIPEGLENIEALPKKVIPIPIPMEELRTEFRQLLKVYSILN